MGYWEQSEEGYSFTGADRTPEPLIWGDQPADIVDDAIWQITAVFIKDVGRLPSKAEMMAGLTFSTRALALPDRPENSPSATEEDLKVLEEDYYPATYGDENTPTKVLAARRAVTKVMRRLAKPFEADR